MAYSKDAFKCHKCPKEGCPLWWKTIWTDGKEEKIVESCGYEQLPLYLTEVIKASNRPAAGVESLRNELKKDFVSTLNLMGNHMANNMGLIGNGDKDS